MGIDNEEINDWPLKTEQNGRHFASKILECMFWHENPPNVLWFTLHFIP